MAGISIEKKLWGRTPEGSDVHLFHLRHNTMELCVSSYGAIITDLRTPDQTGAMSSIVLGYDSLDSYLADSYYLGCVVGRVANRISQARFFLGGHEYCLNQNHGVHQLHGGEAGFNTYVWDAVARVGEHGPCVEFSRYSDDCEQGFPGGLHVQVTYTLTDTSLHIRFFSEAEADTVVNMTNHTYFNLDTPLVPCMDHVVQINADNCLAADAELIPTGEMVAVAGTHFDFSKPRSFQAPSSGDEASQGFDHYYVLKDSPIRQPAVRVFCKKTGRVLEMYTTYPGVQLYSGNHLPCGMKGRNKEVYGPQHGFCLEAQGYPDAPNRPEFPSIMLCKGQSVTHETEYRFSTSVVEEAA